MTQEFLGVGWKFPVNSDPQGVEVALSRYEEDIREAIWIILSTAKGERLMRPEFGCGIHQFVFAPNNSQTAGMVRFHVEDSLVRWEPRIILDEVKAEPDPTNPALILIRISYRVRASDSRFNLVYPFYLERGQTA